MEVCFSDLKEKEIVNVFDGRKLGRIIDILFDASTGMVRGIVVPGDKKLFRKNEDIFVPLEKLKKIGDDVILVSLQVANRAYPFDASERKNPQALSSGMAANSMYDYAPPQRKSKRDKQGSDYSSYIRYRPVEGKKYK